MGTIIVKIPFVTWRNGRPRFVASAQHRALGYKGLDLKAPDGSWMTIDQASAWSDAFALELEQRRAAKAAGKRLPKIKAPEFLTVAQAVQALLDLPEMQLVTDAATRAKKGIKPSKTVRWYRGMAKAVEAYDPKLWQSPAAAISREAAKGFYRKLAADKGLSMANGMVALLRRAWGEHPRVLPVNPFMGLKVKAPPPRLRAGEIEEMETLLAAADAIGRPDVGDAIMMGLMTGQRQNDRLRLIERGRVDGEIIFRQSKTGAVVSVPALPQLEARLVAARERRRSWKVQFPEVLVDERLQRPWPDKDNDTTYWKAYRQVLAAAIAGVMDAEASAAAALEGRNEPLFKVAPCPSLKGFRDQDLRDTSVTWLGRAGCTIPEICAITGHSETSATEIMKHYLGKHPEMARTAMKKMAAWLSGKGAKL